jgi:hypothetical protein
MNTLSTACTVLHNGSQSPQQKCHVLEELPVSHYPGMNASLRDNVTLHTFLTGGTTLCVLTSRGKNILTLWTERERKTTIQTL